MRWRSRIQTALLLGLILSAGCVSRQTVADAPPDLADPATSTARTAILPFANETNTVAAPEILRKLLFDEAARRRYALQPMEETDRRLRERLQISDGGQLAIAEPSELGEALDIETLFYGDVLEWKKVTTGVYNEVTVKARLRLVDAVSGRPLWEKTHAISKKNLATSIDEMVAGTIQNLLLNPMTPYARRLMRDVGQSLPPPPPVMIPRRDETATTLTDEQGSAP